METEANEERCLVKREKKTFEATHRWSPSSTSVDQLSSFVDQIAGDVIRGVDEALEADRGETALPQVEVGGDAQDANQDGEVDVEAVRDDGDHVQVAHDLEEEQLSDQSGGWHHCVAIMRGFERKQKLLSVATSKTLIPWPSVTDHR